MKKRVLSIVLTLALVLSLMPALGLTAAATDAVTVRLTGQSVVGQTLTAVVDLPEGYADKPVSYQWQHYINNGIIDDIPDATGQTYTVKPEDIGKVLRVFVTVDEGNDGSINGFSNTTTAVSTDTKLITCGSENWTYKFYLNGCYSSNVSSDTSGTYGTFAFYNGGTTDVTSPLLTVKSSTIGTLLDSSDLAGMLSSFSGATGASASYAAAAHTLTVTPIFDRGIPAISIDAYGALTIGTDTYDTSGAVSGGTSKTLAEYGLAYSYDATNGAKLTINGVDGVGPIIQSNTTKNAISSDVDLEIVLNVDTLVKCTEPEEGHKAINVNADLKITGKHNLTATSLGDVIYAGNITIDVDNLTAVAKGDEGSGIIAENTLSILGDTTLEVSGIDCGLTVGGDLVLNNATIDAADSECISCGIESTYDDLTIVLVGENRIGKAVTYDGFMDGYSVRKGIYANGNITFTGSGSLTIYDLYAGITAQNVTFGTDTAPFSGTLTVEDFGNIPSCAIDAGGDVTINGGTFNLTSYESNGISAGGTVTINGGKVMAKSSSEEGKYAISATGGLTIADTMEVVNANETYTSGTTEPLTAKDNGFVTIQPKAKPSSGRSSAPSGHTVLTDLSGITAVYVDGKKVDSKYYSISGGNIILSGEFMKTLANGKHTVKLYDGAKVATGVITVTGNTNVASAATGDAGLALYAALSVSSMLGMGWVGKKKRDEE